MEDEENEFFVDEYFGGENTVGYKLFHLYFKRLFPKDNLKNSVTVTEDKVEHIINEIHKFTQSSPSNFYKMLEGIPNFHRWIGRDLINSYSIKYTKHSIHMFAWNKDIADVRKIIMEVCRPLKLLAGLSLFEFENHTPKDLIVERLQIARYPPTGFIEAHLI